MNNFFNENKKLFLIILSISIIIPIIILTPSPIGIIEYETGLTLIGYCGSILGGFLTLYGVWWTIKDSDKKALEQKQNFINQQKLLDAQRRYDIAMQYRPILHCQVKNYVVMENNSILVVYFNLKNTGRAEALNIHIESSSTHPVFSKVTHDYSPIIEMNNNFEFVVTFIHLGRSLGNNQFERLPLDNLFSIKKIHPSASIKIIFTDIVDTNYCLQFDLECQYTSELNTSNINGMNLEQIGDKIKTSPKIWKFNIKNLKTTNIK